MNIRWLNIRESTVSLLRIFAVLVALLLLSQMGIGVFTSIDKGTSWNEVLSNILHGIALAAYYGGAVFALSWIVSLIGNQTKLIDEKIVSRWLDNGESAVSLLKKLAVLIFIFELLVAGIGVFTSIDKNLSWDYTTSNILGNLAPAAFKGGIVFALAWIVSLIGQRNMVTDEKIGSRWLDNRESAVSLLKKLAMLIVLFGLLAAGIEVFEALDQNSPWYYTVSFWGPALATVYGGTVLALSWIVSLIGNQTKLIDEKIVSRWRDNRESAVSLLKIMALLTVLFYLLAAGTGVFAALDQSNPWYNIVIVPFGGLTLAAFYGGSVFALSWVVSLIGKRTVVTEERFKNRWLSYRESGVSLLKIMALLIVLFQLLIAGIGVFVAVDQSSPWYNIVSTISWGLAPAAFYGGSVFALSWVVSLSGKHTEITDEKIKSKWQDRRKSAVSLLKAMAVLRLSFGLLLAGITIFTSGDRIFPSWDFTVRSTLSFLFWAAFEGCIL